MYVCNAQSTDYINRRAQPPNLIPTSPTTATGPRKSMCRTQGLQEYNGKTPGPGISDASWEPRRRLCRDKASNPSSRREQRHPTAPMETKILSSGRGQTPRTRPRLKTLVPRAGGDRLPCNKLPPQKINLQTGVKRFLSRVIFDVYVIQSYFY